VRRLVLFELRHVAQWWPGSAWETNCNILCRHWPFPRLSFECAANGECELGHIDRQLHTAVMEVNSVKAGASEPPAFFARGILAGKSLRRHAYYILDHDPLRPPAARRRTVCPRVVLNHQPNHLALSGNVWEFKDKNHVRSLTLPPVAGQNHLGSFIPIKSGRKRNVSVRNSTIFRRAISLQKFDEGKLDPLGTGMLALDESDPHAQKDQFADGTSLPGGLLLRLPVKRSWDINGCPNGLLFHTWILPWTP
jgi:hypothetical protein